MTALKEVAQRLGVTLGNTGIENDPPVISTNEVALDHYFAMRKISHEILKDKDYSVEELSKAVKEAYDIRYHQIVKEYEEGTRQIPESLGNIQSLTLEEDLAELDKAFQKRLTDIDTFAFVRQVNQEFALVSKNYKPLK